MIAIVSHLWNRRLGVWRKELLEQMHAAAKKEIQELANDTKDTVKRKIEAGEVGGPPLSPEWVKSKARRGKDPRMLIETRGMIESLQVSAGEDKGEEGFAFGIGMFESAETLRGAPDALPLFHEYGVKAGRRYRVPKRPVWRRAFTETKAKSPAYRRLRTGKWFKFKAPRTP